MGVDIDSPAEVEVRFRPAGHDAAGRQQARSESEASAAPRHSGPKIVRIGRCKEKRLPRNGAQEIIAETSLTIDLLDSKHPANLLALEKGSHLRLVPQISLDSPQLALVRHPEIRRLHNIRSNNLDVWEMRHDQLGELLADEPFH